MSDDHNQDNTNGQGGMDSETERRNRENETGQQAQTPAEPEGETSFVGSRGDQSSDYLTKGENQDFQPEGQGASDSDAGDADITTGQPTSNDSTLDDGADTSR